MANLVPVPFRDATLYLADLNGVPYTPMKPIVEGMGLSWQPQHEKIKSNQRLSATITEIVMVANDGKQREMVCLPLRKLPGWLMTISPNKVKPEIRDTVIAYQNECDDALWDYWSKGQATRKADVPQNFADALQLAADQQRIIQQQQDQLQAAAPKVAFHDQVTYESDTLIDFAKAFSLLKRRCGQTFTDRTFLVFMRRHGIACQPNIYANIGRDRFKPRKKYINTWFVSEMTERGTVEWMMRPLAISEIVRLIEQERVSAAMVAGYLPQTAA